MPREELYCPPLTIKVRDNRWFGRTPMVGCECVKTLQPYMRELGDGGDVATETFDVVMPTAGRLCVHCLYNLTEIMTTIKSLKINLWGPTEKNSKHFWDSGY